jgi:hypothetical protein
MLLYFWSNKVYIIDTNVSNEYKQCLTFLYLNDDTKNPLVLCSETVVYGNIRKLKDMDLNGQ